ncbi:MAG: hypothetical protein ACREP9_10895 [Candidatus Dormibacteraceae bacterium]
MTQAVDLREMTITTDWITSVGTGGQPRPPAVKDIKAATIEVARHEAAHAAVYAHLIGEIPISVSIRPGQTPAGPCRGWMTSRVPNLDLLGSLEVQREILNRMTSEARREIRQAVEDHVVVVLAGPMIDRQTGPEVEVKLDAWLCVAALEGTSDVWSALKLLEPLEANDDERQLLLYKLGHEADRLVRVPKIRLAIDSLGEALLERTTLEREELASLLGELVQSKTGGDGR